MLSRRMTKSLTSSSWMRHYFFKKKSLYIDYWSIFAEFQARAKVFCTVGNVGEQFFFPSLLIKYADGKIRLVGHIDQIIQCTV